MAELTVDDLHLAYGDNPILKGVVVVCAAYFAARYLGYL